MYQLKHCITTIDAHTAGEPIRVVTSGFPVIAGRTMLEKKRTLAEEFDSLRKLIMLEPRGHNDMFGAILTPPVTPDGHFGVLFTHNKGQGTMCGHGTLGVAKVVAETGMVPTVEGENTIRLDAPAGRVVATVWMEGGRATDVSFENVPAFLYRDRVRVSLDGVGEIEIAICYAGAFYVFANARDLGLAIERNQLDALRARGMQLKQLINRDVRVVHPEHPDIKDIYGTILISESVPNAQGWEGSNVCVFAEGAIDRSPCGTGTSARMALLHARGMMKPGQKLLHRSILGTEFTGTILEETPVADVRGIRSRVAGLAWIVGFNQLVLDPDDPLPEGFQL